MLKMICVGVAVRKIQRESNLLEMKIGSNGKIFIGVPFQEKVPIPIVENVKDYLITNGIVHNEDIIGNYMFIQN